MNPAFDYHLRATSILSTSFTIERYYVYLETRYSMCVCEAWESQTSFDPLENEDAKE